MTLRGKDDSNPVPWTMKLYDTTVGLSALGAILITTSKTSLLALGILAAASLLRIGARHRWLLVTQMSRLALALVMLGAFALTLVPFALPTEAAGNLDDTLSEYGALPRLLFHSLVERAQDVWPRAVASMSDPLAWITGRGLGGVGAPQMYFAPDSYNPADNIHVYLWLSFGGVVLLLLLVFLLALIGRLVRSPGPDAALVAFLTTLLAFGATLNVIEASMLMAGLGVLLASHEAARDHGH